jgi:thiamine-phosphate pyrophosphorylase
MPLAQYWITNRHLAGGLPQLLALITRRLESGAPAYLQIREKDLDARELYHFTLAVLALPQLGQTKVIVNSRLDVALAARAHGAHLPSGSPAPNRLRAITPAGFLLGASAHSPADAIAAHQTGADYCLLAPIFQPLSKSDTRQPLGLDALREAVQSVPIPVFALGGITPAHFEAVAATGAAGIAGISLLHSP